MEDFFRPKVDVGRFLTAKFALEDYMKYLFQYMPTKEVESQKFNSLSEIQKQLYSYYLIEGQVSNGGFVQALFNGYAQYMNNAVIALEQIGQEKCREIVSKAQQIGQRNKLSFFTSRLKGLAGLFGSGLYDKNETLNDLDEEFYKHTKKNDFLFRKYIWANKDTLISKASIPIPGKNGICQTHHPDGSIYQEYKLVKNGIDGWYLEYNNHGHLKIKKRFLDGEYVHESEVFHEEGYFTSKTYLSENKVIEEDYDQKGTKINLKTVNPITGNADGEYIAWYSNGNMRYQGFSSHYNRYGETKHYYENGKLKFVGQAKGYDFFMQDYYAEDGTQTLSQGNGCTISKSIKDGVEQLTVEEYAQGVRHGKSKLIVNGIVQKTDLYQHGKLVR